MGDKTPSAGASGTNGRKKSDNRTFRSIPASEEIEFLEKRWEAHSTMTTEEKQAFLTYKGQGFRQINKFLRDPEGYETAMNYIHRFKSPEDRESWKEYYRNAARVLAAAPANPLGEDTMLYRGMNVSRAEPGKPANDLSRFLFDGLDNGTLIGSTFTDKGFGSTTIDATQITHRNVQLRIRAPKETKVFTPNPDINATNGDEMEILLKPNTSYTVRSYTQSGDNIILEVDID